MTTATIKIRLFIIVILLAALSSGQVSHAQDYTSGCTVETPQWVLDRQQYETTYVYVPPVVEIQDAAGMDDIPQWVLDRQQYETTYAYVPSTAAMLEAAGTDDIPQWVIDRQQYETTYAYVPSTAALAFGLARCSTVQAPNS